MTNKRIILFFISSYRSHSLLC